MTSKHHRYGRRTRWGAVACLLLPLMSLPIPLNAVGAEGGSPTDSSTEGGSPTGSPLPDLEAAVRRATIARANKQADGLIPDDRLAAIARDHSEDMFRVRKLGHELRGSGPAERLARHHRTLFGLVSENVGYHRQTGQQADIAKTLLEGWMASPGHRANILADYRVFETGCFGTPDTAYCTQLFVREPTTLAAPVPYRQSAGGTLVLALAGPPAAHEGRRIGIAPVGGRSADPGAEVRGGEAHLTLPTASGHYQLQLWTPEPGNPGHFRVIGGPYVCIGADSSTAEPRTGSCPG